MYDSRYVLMGESVRIFVRTTLDDLESCLRFFDGGLYQISPNIFINIVKISVKFLWHECVCTCAIHSLLCVAIHELSRKMNCHIYIPIMFQLYQAFYMCIMCHLNLKYAYISHTCCFGRILKVLQTNSICINCITQ